MEARELTAERLLESSLRTSYDPIVEIDWTAPHLPGAYWLPPRRSSLYGTPLWDKLSPKQHAELRYHSQVFNLSQFLHAGDERKHDLDVSDDRGAKKRPELTPNSSASTATRRSPRARPPSAGSRRSRRAGRPCSWS